MGNARGVKRDFQALERRRFTALKLLQQGYNQSEVGRRVKVCSQTISRWARARFRTRREGLGGGGPGWQIQLDVVAGRVVQILADAQILFCRHARHCFGCESVSRDSRSRLLALRTIRLATMRRAW